MVSLIGKRLAAVAAFCVASFVLTPANVAAQTSEERYRLQPGDVVLVNVLEDPELDAQALVLPDGRMSMPVAGTLMAGGRAPEELAAAIRARLRDSFVQAPSVTVSVVSVASPEELDEEEEIVAEVYVLGEVARPGRYEYDGEEPITVIEALTLAGGPGPFAATKRIQVREEVEVEGERTGVQAMRLFNYDSFEDGALVSPEDLADLADGAVIVVPERRLFE